MRDDVPWRPLLGLLFAGLVTGFAFGCMTVESANKDLKANAVQRGYAEWKVVDQATGKTEFVWVEFHTPRATQDDEGVYHLSPELWEELLRHQQEARDNEAFWGISP